MKEFEEALVSSGKSENIPEAQNLFGALIGVWDFEWIDGHGTQEERHVKGEWIFSWILEGMAVQDLFICPCRAERDKNPLLDSEYGTTIRIYNPEKEAWDVFYGCAGEAIRLTAYREGSRIVLVEKEYQKMKWIFSDLTEDTFHWQKFVTQDRIGWQIAGEVFAHRRKCAQL